MNSSRLLLSAAITVVITCSSSAAEWKSGFGQGNTEYLVENGPGNRFIINCDTGATMDHSQTGILIDIIGKGPPPRTTVNIIVDGEELRMFSDENGIISANCHACSGQFIDAWGKIRKGKTMLAQFSDGRSSSFSLQSVKKILPAKACRTGYMG